MFPFDFHPLVFLFISCGAVFLVAFSMYCCSLVTTSGHMRIANHLRRDIDGDKLCDFSTGSGTIRLMRRDHGGGVSFVSGAQTYRLGFLRSLVPYRVRTAARKRGRRETGEGYTCMDFVEPYECHIDGGRFACDFCADKKKADLRCVHMSRPFRYTQDDGSVQTIRANLEPHLGWCLPSEFERRLDSNCNPNTGRWLLTREKGEASFVCRCRYPNLMTNSSSVKDDCSLPVGCYPGRLDEDSRAGRVDPYTSGFCNCPASYYPDFDPTVGPLCRPNSILDEPRGDNGLADVLAARGLESNYKVLPISHASPLFLQLFDGSRNNPSNDPRLPDPCSIDVLSGRAFTRDEEGCYLERKWIAFDFASERSVLTRFNGQSTKRQFDGGKIVVYCDSRNPRFLPVQTSSDYLLNNHGRYPNACLRLSDNPLFGMQTGNEATNLSSLFMLSHYNSKYYPDVGVVISDSTRHGKKRDERREKLFELAELVSKDELFQKLVVDAVRPVKPYGSKPLPLRHDLDEFIRRSRTLVVYTHFPDVYELTVSEEGNPKREAICCGLVRFVYNLFRTTPVKANLVYGQFVNKFYRRISTPVAPDRYKLWAVQTSDEYNNYYVGSSWTREIGQVPPASQALYTEWVPVRPNKLQSLHRSKILFAALDAKDALYPPEDSYCEIMRVCNTPNVISGTTGHFDVLPSLWTTVYRDADRPLVPNSFHPGFDCTVMLAFFGDEGQPSEVVLLTEQLSSNYLGVQQYARLFREDRNPKVNKVQEDEDKKKEKKFSIERLRDKYEEGTADEIRRLAKMFKGRKDIKIVGDGMLVLEEIDDEPPPPKMARLVVAPIAR